MSTPEFEVHRAIVHSSNVTTGAAEVRIPSLLGAGQTVNIPTTGLTLSAGEWNVPSVGSSAFVAVSADRTQFLWITGVTVPTDSTTDFTDNVTIGGDLTVDGTIDATHINSEFDGPVVISIKNTSGSTIAKGTPVYATGSVGQSGAVEVSPSRADTSGTMPALGLTQVELVHNGEGHAVVLGVIDQMDTSTYAINDSLYVAPTGGLTNTRPTGSDELVQKIGRVVRVNQSTGEILVLGAGRTNDVPNVVVAGGLTIDTDTLHVDAVNDRVGIGTASPRVLLDIQDPTLATVFIEDTGGTVGADASARVAFLAGGGIAGQVGFLNTTDGTMKVQNSVGDIKVETFSADDLYLRTDDTDRMTVTGTGNVGINDTTPSYKLDVNGTGRFTGDLSVNATLITDYIRNDNGNFIAIEGGDSWNLGSNASGEYVWLAAEGGLMIVSSDSNDVTWANREQIRITAEGGIDNRLRVHGQLRTNVTGSYGTIQTANVASWDGFSINGRVVFMHDDGSNWGIYNDVNNHWMVYGQLNGDVELRYANSKKFETTSTGINVTGRITTDGVDSVSPTVLSSEYVHRFRNEANSVSSGGMLVENRYGNHSWGMVAEFRVDATSGDSPGIMFSKAANSQTFSVGYGYNDTSILRFKRDHGHRNGQWGTTLMEVNRSQNLTVWGNGYKPGGGSWASTSDARLKTDVEAYTSGLDVVNSLRPVVYSWDVAPDVEVGPNPGTEELSPFFDPDQRHIGLLAQEVVTVMPNWVEQENDPATRASDGEIITDVMSLSVKNDFYAVAVSAIQELSSQVTALTARIEVLEGS